MEVFYPKYYEQFVCIADRCPDSCCQGWSVDVDERAAAFYRTLPGELGDRLRQVLQDADGGAVMTLENGRCPMWRQDSLCRIHAELGHDALCKVCREFPRLRHDYGTFVEFGLELSCPEAARLILTSPDQHFCVASGPEAEEAEYDTWAMDILRRTRSEFLTFLDATPLPFGQVLAVLLLYAHEVQAELDGGESATLSPEDCLADAKHYAQPADPRALHDFFLGLEILTPQWKERLEMPASAPQWDDRHKALLRYFLQRYWLQAVSDYDVLCRAKFAIAACLLISSLGGSLLQTAQLFSKEVENDPDNVEAILDSAYSAPALTDASLLGRIIR